MPGNSDNTGAEESANKLSPLGGWLDTALQTLIVQSSPFQRDLSLKRSRSSGGIFPSSPIPEFTTQLLKKDIAFEMRSMYIGKIVAESQEGLRLTKSMNDSLIEIDDLSGIEQSTGQDLTDGNQSTSNGLSTITEHEDTVDGFRSSLKEAKERLEQIKKEKEELLALQKQTAHELSNMTQTNQALIKESDEREVEYAIYKEEVQALKETLIEREEELQLQKQESVQLQALLKEKDLKIDQLNEKNHELKSQVVCCMQELQHAKDDNNNIMQSLQHTQEFLQEAKTEGEQCRQMLTQCKDMLVDAEERREQLRIVIEQKEKEIINVLNDNRKLKDVLENYENQLDPNFSRQQDLQKNAPIFVSLFWLFF
ncbi:hypothetical protein TrispH2_008360 [Trichoplax sp. H2]|nr:hypothetical protein TrispH2_008360 [Trichoplax sp. H2]|eukprot:RDD39388.1 hypothetical protein TrispH2_008360 [Trichoplax sp. H2]